MKKLISVLLGILTIAFANTSYVLAQSAEKSLAMSKSANNAGLIAYTNENKAAVSDNLSLKSAEENLKSSKESLKALKANLRATKNFKKEFKSTDDAVWNNGQNAIVASFTRNDVRTVAVYDTKGNWIHTLDYYAPDKTPEKVNLAVERVYPNADIKLTVDVKEGDMRFYIVQLEDKRTYKKVVIYGDEIELIDQMKKNN